MARAFTYTPTAMFTRETGEMTDLTERGLTSLRMAKDSKVSSWKAVKVGLEFTTIKTATFTVGNGQMTRKMGMALMFTRKPMRNTTGKKHYSK
jgi:hypothetical protein